MDSHPSSAKEPSSSGVSSSPSIAQPVTSLESLSSLIEKRTSSWIYIQQAHSASSDHWFQTTQVSRSQIDRYLAETLGSVKSTQRTRNLFVLGMSLGPILDAETPTDWCRSLSRLMDEWEVWNEVGLSGRNMGMGNGVKNLFRNQRVARKSASPVDAVHDHVSYNTGASNAQQGTGAQRSSETALIIINIPFALDYCQVVMTLCDIIRQLYRRLGVLVLGLSNIGPPTPLDSLSPYGGQGVNVRSGECSVSWPPGLTDLITKADQKVKKILHAFVRDMEQIAQTAVNQQLESLIRNLSATQGPLSIPNGSTLTDDRSPVSNSLHESGVMTG